MIARIIIIAAVVAVVHGFFCPPNEIFTLFGCSDKCSDLGKGCVPRRFIGFRCVCQSGYRRNDQGRCIPKQKCCTKDNEVFSETGVERTCDDVAKLFFFPHNIDGRCVCKNETARDSNGNCVPEIECYPKCEGDNEIYKKNACDKKCNIKGEDQSVCPLTSGCKCKDGYIRQDLDGTCVLPADCQCEDENECYMPSGCDKNCYGQNVTVCPGPTMCYCHDGYRRKNGKCIKKEECKRE